MVWPSTLQRSAIDIWRQREQSRAAWGSLDIKVPCPALLGTTQAGSRRTGVLWYADLIACTAKLPNLLVASSLYMCCQGNPLRLKELELALPLISSQEEAATSSRQGRVHATYYAVSY